MFEVKIIKDEFTREKWYYRVNKRKAVRGIIFFDDKILMVHTNRGEYKFPGGGVKKDEELETALIREITEETGYCDVTVKGLIGTAFEQNIDTFENEAYFQMQSYYYECSLNSLKKVRQKLDSYEAALGFQGEFVSLQEAFQGDLSLMNSDLGKEIDWLERETEVLKILIQDRA